MNKEFPVTIGSKYFGFRIGILALICLIGLSEFLVNLRNGDLIFSFSIILVILLYIVGAIVLRGARIENRKHRINISIPGDARKATYDPDSKTLTVKLDD